MPRTTSFRSITKETKVLLLCSLLFVVLLIRLAWLQVVHADKYRDLLFSRHYNTTNIESQRGNIYVMDGTGGAIPLTQNVVAFSVGVDPGLLREMLFNTIQPNEFQIDYLTNYLTPLVYEQLCPDIESVVFSAQRIPTGDDRATILGCIRATQNFIDRPLLPDPTYTEVILLEETYMDENEEEQRAILDTIDLVDDASTQQLYDEVLLDTTPQEIYSMIYNEVQQRIAPGWREKNYLGDFTLHREVLRDLVALESDFLVIEGGFAFVNPTVSRRPDRDARVILEVLESHNMDEYTLLDIRDLFVLREKRYISLLSDVPAHFIQQLRGDRQAIIDEYARVTQEYRNRIREIQAMSLSSREKNELVERARNETIEEQTRLNEQANALRAIVFEEQIHRYYPLHDFASQVIGYVNKEGRAIGGVEEYMDDLLSGIDGQVEGLTSFRGTTGVQTDYSVARQDGSDIHLTIDFTLQEYVQSLADDYNQQFRSDAVGILVVETDTGYVKASASAPTFNLNEFNDIHNITPLTSAYAYLLQDDSYMDIPLVVRDENGAFRVATMEERKDSSLPKYMYESVGGPWLTRDKNMSFAYEPGSSFKSITVAVGLDTEEIELDEYYYDRGTITVDNYSISNVSKKCEGENTRLDGLRRSCNVGMIEIVELISDHVFYTYLDRLGFGQRTNVELANEPSGFLDTPGSRSYSRSRFFNNSFGQGVQMTSLQLAMSYAAMINGGILYRPQLVAQICSGDGTCRENKPEPIRRVFSEETSEQMRYGLAEIVNQGFDDVYDFQPEGYTIGGKAGTSQIAFGGRYRSGLGWTMGGFAGTVSADNPKYAIVVMVWRPRTSVWSANTSVLIYKDVADFLLSYYGIES